MSDRSLARSILGGAAVVALSGLAAFFGAGLAQREPAPVLRSAPPAADSAVLESIERRLDFLERRVEAIESRQPASQDSEPPTPPRTPVPKATQPDPSKAAMPTPAATDDVPIDPEKSAEATRRDMFRTFVGLQMKLYADTSTEAPAHRLTQAVGDSTQLIAMFGLRGDDVLDKVRKIYQDQWDSGAREIGPLVHDGLPRADTATVRERLHGLWAETDRRLRPLFDDEKWKDYEAKSVGLRKPIDDVIDEAEKTRLSGK